MYKTKGFSRVGQKKIPTVSVFPTVLVFSYGTINPTVRISRLSCIQFVVPLQNTAQKYFLSKPIFSSLSKNILFYSIDISTFK
jgi:hypothetical protein